MPRHPEPMAHLRPADAPRRADIAPAPAEAWLEPRREDLAALVAAYRHATQGPRAWRWVAAGLGGLALGPLLISLGESLRWPAALAPWFFALGWSIMLGCYAVVWRRERRARAEFQFPCAACGAPLIDGSLGSSAVGRAELAIASGHCPACGERILAP